MTKPTHPTGSVSGSGPGQTEPSSLLTATAFATERLREAILNGDFGPGERLPQHLLAARFGLSHVPLREAFQRLEFEGFIAISPRRGAFVVPLTTADAAEIFELRSNLETAALHASVEHLSPEELSAAAEICLKADHVSGKLAYGDLNWQFHRAIYAACQRPRTLKLIETLWKGATRYSMLQRLRDPDIRRSHQEHWKILEAAGRKDSDGAVELLRAHIKAAGDRVLKLLQS